MAVKKSEPEPFADENDAEGQAAEAAYIEEKRAQQEEIVKASSTPREVELKSANAPMKIAAAELKELSLDQLVEMMGASEVTDIIPTDQYGPIADQVLLVGKPFMLVHWEFHEGDFGEFVSMWIMDLDGKRYIVNDGSTGIYQQLRETTDKKGVDSMVVCRHGLKESSYMYTGPDGKERPAKTYYIDNRL
jgi:hypothetical protein